MCIRMCVRVFPLDASELCAYYSNCEQDQTLILIVSRQIWDNSCIQIELIRILTGGKSI